MAGAGRAKKAAAAARTLAVTDGGMPWPATYAIPAEVMAASQAAAVAARPGAGARAGGPWSTGVGEGGAKKGDKSIVGRGGKGAHDMAAAGKEISSGKHHSKGHGW